MMIDRFIYMLMDKQEFRNVLVIARVPSIHLPMSVYRDFG